MQDPIIVEGWKNRDMLATHYGHNLDAIVAAMKKRQRRPLTNIVRPGPPNKRMQRVPQRTR
jgi:hypothetical protein